MAELLKVERFATTTQDHTELVELVGRYAGTDGDRSPRIGEWIGDEIGLSRFRLSSRPDLDFDAVAHTLGGRTADGARVVRAPLPVGREGDGGSAEAVVHTRFTFAATDPVAELWVRSDSRERGAIESALMTGTYRALGELTANNPIVEVRYGDGRITYEGARGFAAAGLIERGSATKDGAPPTLAVHGWIVGVVGHNGNAPIVEARQEVMLDERAIAAAEGEAVALVARQLDEFGFSAALRGMSDRTVETPRGVARDEVMPDDPSEQFRERLRRVLGEERLAGVDARASQLGPWVAQQDRSWLDARQEELDRVVDEVMRTYGRAGLDAQRYQHNAASLETRERSAEPQEAELLRTQRRELEEREAGLGDRHPDVFLAKHGEDLARAVAVKRVLGARDAAVERTSVPELVGAEAAAAGRAAGQPDRAHEPAGAGMEM